LSSADHESGASPTSRCAGKPGQYADYQQGISVPDETLKEFEKDIAQASVISFAPKVWR